MNEGNVENALTHIKQIGEQMPCQVTKDEVEHYERLGHSKTLAKFIIRVEAHLGNHPATWILAAATTGNAQKVEELSIILCTALRELEKDPEQMDEVVYNGRDPDSRRLADWWEEHCVNDVRHVEEDSEFKSRSEFKGFTSDRKNVIINAEWYKKVIIILDSLTGV